MKTILLILSMLGLAGQALADQKLSVPRFDGLGRHHHPITTRWPLAQRYFDQGLTLCFNFNHAEAVRSFEAAATVDPECAMAYWGMASTAAICAALVPMLVNAPGVDKIYPTIASLVVVVIVALEGVFHPREVWRNYDLISAVLREEEMR